MSLPKINYARLGDSIVHIDKVANGIDCGCTCLKCGSLLVAKNMGVQKTHHFAHYKTQECHFAYETMLHELAKEIIAEDLSLGKLPQKLEFFKEIYRNIDISSIFTDFIISQKECFLGDVIPDVVLTDKNGKQLCVEIKVTHRVDEIKKEKIINQNLSCLEIDLSSLNHIITKDELRDYIKHTHKTKWINFYFDNKERKQILNNFIKNDIFEMIPQIAIKNYRKQFCGKKYGFCNSCTYCKEPSPPDKVLCCYKMKNLNFDANSNYEIVRDNEYFITKVIYKNDNDIQQFTFKTFDEIDKQYIFSKDDVIKIGLAKYGKLDLCGNIETLWKQRNRTVITLINDKNDIYEVYRNSYINRNKNKYINATKIMACYNTQEKIFDYKKKIWHELIKIND